MRRPGLQRGHELNDPNRNTVAADPNRTRVLTLGIRGKGKWKEPGVGRAPRTVYWQLDAIILTESTFSFGWLTLEVVDALVDELVEWLDEAPPSTVPVISTLCPTCGVSWLSSASS
jgi:hypothetical protein